MAVSNVQIDRLGRKNIKGYQGAFSKDRLPKLRRSGFYIVNLEDYGDGEGSHWVMLQVKPGPGHGALYVDSYGLPPPLAVRSWTGPNLKYSDSVIQGTKSENCGRFAYYVARELSRGRTISAIIRDFVGDRALNDGVVVRAWRAG